MKLITNGNSILLLLFIFTSSKSYSEEYTHAKAIDNFLFNNQPTVRYDNENKFKIIDDNILRLTQKYIDNGCEEAAGKAMELARIYRDQYIDFESVKNRMRLLRNKEYFYKYNAFIPMPEGDGQFSIADSLQKLKDEDRSFAYTEWKYVAKFGVTFSSWFHADHPPYDLNERIPFIKRTLIPRHLYTGDLTVFFKMRTRHDYGQHGIVFEEDFIYADDIPTKNADEEELKKSNKPLREFYVNFENKLKKEVTDFLINAKCRKSYVLLPEKKPPHIYFELQPDPYFGVFDSKRVLDLLDKVIGPENVISIFPKLAQLASNNLKKEMAKGAYSMSKINQADSVDMIERYKIAPSETDQYFISKQMIRNYLLERRQRLYQLEIMSHYINEMINTFPFLEYKDPTEQKSRVEKSQRMIGQKWKSIDQ